MRIGIHVGPKSTMVSLATLLAVATFAACEDGETTGPERPAAPTLQLTASADTVTATWALVSGATSYRLELRSDPDTIAKTLAGTDSQAVVTSADGLRDNATYTAILFAINEAGETESSNSPTVVTNFFMWDDYFPTSLHATGQGKQTWYNETPNRGFERFTNVAYADLSCKNCHEPSATGGCAACHDSDTPTLGAQVDATLTGPCGSCHGRQKAEALTHGYTDVHRDAGMDCMACHSLEDVHGENATFTSMLDDGAIDAECSDCHTTLASNAYHDTHSSTVDCSACHIQSVVTCYNCHFETQVQMDQKKAYGQFKDWLFLVNRDGKVHAANLQTLNYGNSTFVALAPFYSHTIARSARTCSDCHGNAAMTDWVADSVIDVVTWDAGQGKLTHVNGVIPVPPNYLTGLRFDFVDLDQPGGTVWSFLKTGADTIQILFAEPLTAQQMDKLKQ